MYEDVGRVLQSGRCDVGLVELALVQAIYAWSEAAPQRR